MGLNTRPSPPLGGGVWAREIAERPIRDILGLRDVTLSWNVQNQHDKDNAFAWLAGPLCFVGALVFSFGKLLSYFLLVVGRETHGLLCYVAAFPV